MTPLLETGKKEFGSGEVVEPGLYIDVDSGAIIKINEPDELPEGQKLISYRRRFRRVESLKAESAR